MRLLALYREVIKIPNNQFMEQTLIAASSILYDNEEYSAAFDYFERLEKVTTSSESKLIALERPVEISLPGR